VERSITTCTRESADGRIVGDRVRYTWLVGVLTVYFMKDKGQRVRRKWKSEWTSMSLRNGGRINFGTGSVEHLKKIKTRINHFGERDAP
jgi:hypothetical protein